MKVRVEALLGPGADRLVRSPLAMTLFAGSVLMMMNAGMFSPIMPVLMGQFDVTEARIGLVMTAYTLPAVVVIPFVGPLADRYSRRYLLSGALFLGGVSGLAVAAATRFEHVLVLRAVQGLSYSGVMPIGVALLGDHYVDDVETTAQGLRTVLNNVAATLFPVVGGFLLLVSWRAPFALYVLYFPAAVAAFAFVRDPTPESNGEEAATDRDENYLRDLLDTITSRNVLLVMLTGFTLFFLRYGVVSFLPLFLIRAFDVPVVNTGLYIGLAAACTALGASQAGRFSRWLSQNRIVQIGLGVTGLGMLLVPFVAPLAFSRVVLVVLVAAYGFGWGLAAPTQKSLLNQTVTARVRAGTVSAGYTAQNVGKAVSPALVGVLIGLTNVGVGIVVLGLETVATAALFVYYRPSEEVRE